MSVSIFIGYLPDVLPKPNNSTLMLLCKIQSFKHFVCDVVYCTNESFIQRCNLTWFSLYIRSFCSSHLFDVVTLHNSPLFYSLGSPFTSLPGFFCFPEFLRLFDFYSASFRPLSFDFPLFGFLSCLISVYALMYSWGRFTPTFYCKRIPLSAT